MTDALGIDLLNSAGVIATQLGRGKLRLVRVAGNERLRRYYLDAGIAYCDDIHTRGPNGEHWVTRLFERST